MATTQPNDSDHTVHDVTVDRALWSFTSVAMSCVTATLWSVKSYGRFIFDNLLLSNIFCLTVFSNSNTIVTVDSTVTQF